MYCTNCGKKIPDNVRVCTSCKTYIENGIKFCKHCGHETPATGEFCRYCGGKLSIAAITAIRNEEIAEIEKARKKNKQAWKLTKTLALTGLFLTIGLILFVAFRPAPDGIPELEDVMKRAGPNISPNAYVHDLSPYTTHASQEVLDYWSLNRKMLSGSVVSFFSSIILFIFSAVYKWGYNYESKKISKYKGDD